MFKEYMNTFVRDEEGVETIEFVCLIGVAIGIVAALIKLGDIVVKKVEQAKGSLEGQSFALPATPGS